MQIVRNYYCSSFFVVAAFSCYTYGFEMECTMMLKIENLAERAQGV